MINKRSINLYIVAGLVSIFLGIILLFYIFLLYKITSVVFGGIKIFLISVSITLIIGGIIVFLFGYLIVPKIKWRM